MHCSTFASHCLVLEQNIYYPNHMYEKFWTALSSLFGYTLIIYPYIVVQFDIQSKNIFLNLVVQMIYFQIKQQTIIYKKYVGEKAFCHMPLK